MSPIIKLQVRQNQLQNLIKKFSNVVRLVRKYAYELTVIEGKIEKLIAAHRTSADKFIFSAITVAHALKISKDLIRDIWAYGKDVIVQLTDFQEIHLKRYDALVAMSQIRKSRSRALTVTPHLTNNNGFTVRNESKDSYYRLELSEKSLTCECEDYKQGKAKLGDRYCCKHGYAVLNLLGHATLKDCLAKINELTPAVSATPVRWNHRFEGSYSVTRASF